MNHLACIMDGNRRWAKERGLPPWYGHKEGVRVVEDVVALCLQKGIPHLSLYAFSIENFGRSSEEKNYLFTILAREIEENIGKKLQEWGARVSFVGDETLYPATVIPIFKRMEEETASNTKLHVHILFAYGGRQEITHAARVVARQVQQGLLTLDEITPAYLQQQLWLHGVPDPDLVIRTGGQQRLSNFLLFQSAYSEFYFTNTYWPAFTTDELEKALTHFAECKRNFGQ